MWPPVGGLTQPFGPRPVRTGQSSGQRAGASAPRSAGPGGNPNVPKGGSFTPPVFRPGGGSPWAGTIPAGMLFAALRLGLRFVPWIGLVLLGYELYHLWKTRPGGWGMRVMGYTLTRDCNRGNDFVAITGLSFCGNTTLGIGVWSGLSYPPKLHVWDGSPQSGTGRKYLSQEWTRVAAVPWARYIAPIRPIFWPTHPELDPEVAPIAQPAPFPVPLPPAVAPFLPTTSPHGPPGHPTRVEPSRVRPMRRTVPVYPNPSPWWPTLPEPWTWPEVDPSVPRPVLPGPDVVVGPAPDPMPEPAGPGSGLPPPAGISFRPDRRRPDRRWPRNRPSKPGRGTKEKKLIAGVNSASWLGWALNAATEGGDLVTSIWWALPRRYRTPPAWDPIGNRWVMPGLIQQGKDIYNNLDHVDWEKAGKNIKENAIEDFVFGSVGQLGRRANRAAWEGGFATDGFSAGRGPAM